MTNSDPSYAYSLRTIHWRVSVSGRMFYTWLARCLNLNQIDPPTIAYSTHAHCIAPATWRRLKIWPCCPRSPVWHASRTAGDVHLNVLGPRRQTRRYCLLSDVWPGGMGRCGVDWLPITGCCMKRHCMHASCACSCYNAGLLARATDAVPSTPTSDFPLPPVTEGTVRPQCTGHFVCYEDESVNLGLGR